MLIYIYAYRSWYYRFILRVYVDMTCERESERGLLVRGMFPFWDHSNRKHEGLAHQTLDHRFEGSFNRVAAHVTNFRGLGFYG